MGLRPDESRIANPMDIVFLIYGLSFLALALVVVVWPREESQFELARFIGWLAAFGLVHGFLEWMDLWKVVRGGNAFLATAHPFVLLASYLLLFEFGRRLVRASLPKESGNPAWWWMLDARMHVALVGGVFVATLLARDPLLALGIWSRYLVGTTGSVLAGAGFLRYCQSHIRPALPDGDYSAIRRSCHLGGFALIAYGFLGGLVVPKADWAPAAWLNYETFQAVFHVPVQLFRAVCAVLVAASVGHMLRVFHIEARLRLRHSLDDAEIALVEVRSLGRRNDLLLNSVGEGIFGIDREGRTTFVNPAAVSMLGYAADELLGRSIHALTHHTRADGSPYPVAECPIHRILEDGRVRHEEQDMYWRKDGTGFPVEFRATPVVQGGRITGAVVAFQDITERRQAERTLHEQNAFLSAILENEPECVKIVGPDGRVRQMNAAGLAMLEAASVAEVNARGLMEFVVPEDRRAFADLMGRVFAGGSGSLEFSVMGRLGGHRWLETYAAPLRDAGGKVEYLLGVTRDITARKAAEARLQEYGRHLEEVVASRTRELSRA
ncbi:MAG: PAS domain-containing protein, partial [Rhodocyclaceae bacterium]|nr:PAS domain-containing protein [Rhodocyclaceae bacterium]